MNFQEIPQVAMTSTIVSAHGNTLVVLMHPDSRLYLELLILTFCGISAV